MNGLKNFKWKKIQYYDWNFPSTVKNVIYISEERKQLLCHQTSQIIKKKKRFWGKKDIYFQINEQKVNISVQLQEIFQQ